MVAVIVLQHGPPAQRLQHMVSKTHFLQDQRLLDMVVVEAMHGARKLQHINPRHPPPTTAGLTLLQATAGTVVSMLQLLALILLLRLLELSMPLRQVHTQLLHLDLTMHPHQLPTALQPLPHGEPQLQLWTPRHQATTQLQHLVLTACRKLQQRIGRMMALATWIRYQGGGWNGHLHGWIMNFFDSTGRQAGK